MKATFFFFICYACCLLLCLSACEQKKARKKAAARPAEVAAPAYPAVPPNDFIAFINTPSRWVDSVFRSLSPDERIAQLMIVEAFSDGNPENVRDVQRLVEEYQVGGIIFFQGGPVRQALLTNRFQAVAKVPLLITMDAESGVGMRLDSVAQYPLPQLLGAISSDSLVYELGRQMAAEFRRLGMHLNFTPVADVNNNPRNPIISYRAFGEEKHLVARKSLAMMRGMQDHGIIAVAKHFPGHGDTEVDSHLDLPVIPHSRERLDSIELFPFRELIMAGTGGIMVAHMDIPALDPTGSLPSSLSGKVVTGLLREELGYQGLAVTDALVMKGVTKHFKPGQAEVLALQAGNDVLERLVSVPKAIAAIREAVQSGKLQQAELDRRCKRILAAKLWLGLNKYRPIALEQLAEDLNPPRADTLNRLLAEASLTVVHKEKKGLPVKTHRLLSRQKIASLAMGVPGVTRFQKRLSDHAEIDHFYLPKRSDKKAIDKLQQRLKSYQQVIVGIYGPSFRPSNKLGFNPAETQLITDLAASGKAVVTLFDNAYAISQFPGLRKANAVVVAYQSLPQIQDAAAQLLFGEAEARGTLPVSIQWVNAAPPKKPVKKVPARHARKRR